MTLHYVQLKLGNKSFKTKVSTEGCTFVADLLGVIKNTFPRCLDSYSIAQLTLFRPDGISEIDPETLVADLREIPWEPMIVTVEELPTPARSGSFKQQLVYKGLSTEVSCRKYLDALAIALFTEYEFPIEHGQPTMDDVLAAYRGQQGKCEQTSLWATWWDYRQNDGVPLTNEPLTSRLTAKQWETLDELNRETSDRIHDARLQLTISQKPFIVLPHNDFVDKGTVNGLKSIAATIGVVSTEADFIVKDEEDLSSSSSSESESPDKDMEMY